MDRATAVLVAQKRKSYDRIVLIVSVFFLGWAASRWTYEVWKLPELTQAAQWTGYISSQASLKTLTDQLGACQTTLAKSASSQTD